MHNEFSCLSNALLVAALRVEVPVAFVIPPCVRKMVKDGPPGSVHRVTLHQCPKPGGVTHYVLEVFTDDDGHEVTEFDFDETEGDVPHDTYLLYDQERDGSMKHMHYVH